MYCNNCGKHNPEDSKFCKHCGSEIKRVTSEHKNDTSPDEKKDSSKVEETKSIPEDKKEKGGLTGWLALVGLGLIVTPFIQGYSLYGYLPLFSETFDIPGYMTLLQFEFVMLSILALSSVYLLYLYLKKKENFPKFYIIYLATSAIYSVVDLFFLSSLVAPTPEQQKVISDTLTQSTSDVTRTVILGIIWIAYMLNSKKVKATFVKK